MIETTQQKLYDGSKKFFRKLKDSSTINNGKIRIQSRINSFIIIYQI